MNHTISVLVNNHAGVLMEVATIFGKHGFNIESLAVGITDNPAISRITIVVNCDDETLQARLDVLHQLQDVLVVKVLEEGEYVSRQLSFIKVEADQAARTQVIQIAEIFRGRIIDISPETVTVELTGDDEKVNAMLDMLTDFGIREVVRTGTIALQRGAASII